MLHGNAFCELVSQIKADSIIVLLLCDSIIVLLLCLKSFSAVKSSKRKKNLSRRKDFSLYKNKDYKFPHSPSTVNSLTLPLLALVFLEAMRTATPSTPGALLFSRALFLGNRLLRVGKNGDVRRVETMIRARPSKFHQKSEKKLALGPRVRTANLDQRTNFFSLHKTASGCKRVNSSVSSRTAATSKLLFGSSTVFFPRQKMVVVSVMCDFASG